MASSGATRRIAADFLREQLEMDGLNTSALSQIFVEEPPPLDVFMYDHKYLNHMRPTLPAPDESGYAFKLSPIQWEFLRDFEQIFHPELYIAMVEEFGPHWAPRPMKNMFALEWAKGSGKDTCVRIGFTRIASQLSHLKDPQGYFNMASTDSIHMLNVAATAPQARKAFFDPMKKLFKSNKHLSDFFYGDDPAEGSGQIRLKNDIYIISGNSIAENQEGLNLIAGVADEISAFKVAEEFREKSGGRQAKGAEGIVSFLRSSATSRFPKTYKVAQISFPRFQGDAIEKAVAQGKESIKKYGYEKSQWYVSGPYATWEVKPGVTKDDFREHYDEDPEMAATMYECKPPKATNLFIRDETSIDMAFSETKPQPIEVEYYWGLPPSKYREPGPEGAELKEGWQVKFLYDPDFLPKDGALYCLHGDMAIRGDRAGIAMSHVRTWRNEGDDERPVVKNDFTFSFESDLTDSDHPREVQIRWYRQLVWELIDMGFAVETVTFDQFQSYDMMQTLNSYGIDSGLLSLDRNDKVYQNFKDLVLDSRLESYREVEGEDTLVIREVKRLRRAGKKIDHPPAGCFTGETRIPLLDGTFPEIKDLAGKEVWVYSATPEGKIVPGLARGRFTKETVDLVDVLLDNGYVARCTPDHLWMLRDGSYREAKDLRPGIDRLMPITFNWPVNGGYTRVTDKDGARTIREGATNRAESARLLKCDWNVVNVRLKAEGLTFEEAVALSNNNHKVRAVIPVTLSSPVPVFDLEVDEWHNFALSGGVFVHNSKDEADALAGSVFNALEAGGEEDDWDDESGDPMQGMSPADMAMYQSFSGPVSHLGLFGEGSAPSQNPFTSTGYFHL